MTASPIRFLSALLSAGLLTVCSASPSPAHGGATTPSAALPGSQSPSPDSTSAALARLEDEYGARIGVSAVATGDHRSVRYRAEDRFGYASTLKVFAAAELLRSTSEHERLAHVTWTQADLDAAGYAPVTTERLDDGMTLVELAEASVRESDNAAMNLVLDHIGGPTGLDDALTDLGDTTTQVVNGEPELNTIEPGSLDDTTTPEAFTSDLRALLESDALPEPDKELLVDWMSDNATGDTLIRAGAPAGWDVADKSGGAGALRNDIAIATPPDGAPVIITVMTQKHDPADEYEDELLADVAEIVLAEF